MCVPRPRSALIKSPRSIAITNDENRILRIPDSGMMFQQQRHLQDMLVDIHTDPGGFKTPHLKQFVLLEKTNPQPFGHIQSPTLALGENCPLGEDECIPNGC